MSLCVTGCRRRAVHQHHVVYRQHVESYAGRRDTRPLLADARNLVPMCWSCHGAHHNASRRLPVHLLPDSVFEFAAELMGEPATFEYLRRYYDGADSRLDALVPW